MREQATNVGVRESFPVVFGRSRPEQVGAGRIEPDSGHHETHKPLPGQQVGGGARIWSMGVLESWRQGG
jgi:hypothetical protein